MKDITLVTVNWNQRPCVELLLKSFIKHNYEGEPFRLILVDNASTDNSQDWLLENEVPFFAMNENIGHENAINEIYDKIDTQYVLLLDTDVEIKDNVLDYLSYMHSGCISVGELIDKNFMFDSKIKDRISPWFWLFDISEMKKRGVETFRTKGDWSYDVGSEYWELMRDFGFTNHNLIRHPGHQDNDIVSMKYDKHDHIGKVSWNLNNHGDRYSEVMRRRDYVEERLYNYKDVSLKGKFI